MQDIEKFLEMVQNDQFVEGHEVLEARWHQLKRNPQDENEGKILKGLINASTALALQCKGKSEGAQKVWQTYEKYRPLIQSVDSPYKDLYQKADALLYQKKSIHLLIT